MSVSQDRSLDEFVSTPVDRESASDETPVEPATERSETGIDVTLSWSTATVACATCGELVARRWVSSDGLVCESCKVW